MTTITHPPPAEAVQRPEPKSSGSSLLSGMLLMIVVPMAIMLLAIFNGILLSLLLRLAIGSEANLAARMWVIPFSIVLAIVEVVAYEWRCARTVNLVPPIQDAIAEMKVVVQQIESSNRDRKDYFPVLRDRLSLLAAALNGGGGRVSNRDIHGVAGRSARDRGSSTGPARSKGVRSPSTTQRIAGVVSEATFSGGGEFVPSVETRQATGAGLVA